MKGKALFRAICITLILIAAACFVTCDLRTDITAYLEKGLVGIFGESHFDEVQFDK